MCDIYCTEANLCVMRRRREMDEWVGEWVDGWTSACLGGWMGNLTE